MNVLRMHEQIQRFWMEGGGGKAHFHEHRTIRPSIYKLSFQRQKKKKKKALNEQFQSTILKYQRPRK